MLNHSTADAHTLNSIRIALGQEEQQIRVNDSTSREIYDLTLSRSVPYASPIICRTGTPTNVSAPVTSNSGHRILRLPQLVSKRGHTSHSPAPPMPAARSEKHPSVSPHPLTESTSKPDADFSAPHHHPMVGELPPSPPLEADYITGHKQVNANLVASLPSPYTSQLVPSLADTRMADSDAAAASFVTKAPVPRRAYTADPSHFGQASGSAPSNRPSTSQHASPDEPSSFDYTTETRAPLMDRAYSHHRNGSKNVSSISTNSTAYQTASSQGIGSDDDDEADFPTSPVFRSATGARCNSHAPLSSTGTLSIRLTHDMSPYLHQANASEAGPSGHRLTGARQPPSRRNTTGSSAQTRRPTSASSLSQKSGQSGRDRDPPMANLSGIPGWAAEHHAILSQDGTNLALNTGDASFDQEAAKHAEQLRRDKRAKQQKARDVAAAAAAASDTAGVLTDKDGGPLSALTRSKTGRDWRNKEKDDEEPKVAVGNLVGEGHANYVLMYNMLTGIRIGVSRCQAKLKRPLCDDDYSAKHKFTFDIIGNELTPKAKYDFKFKDYAPWVFRELREYFHLDPADYLLSLTSKYILDELGSPGKSGSFFYFSRDYRFIIKTIRHQEHKFLLKILKDYHQHIKANPHTLLSHFYGLHRVKLPHGRKIHFVIMNNLFPPHRDIHETYDLKGSSVGREYPEDKVAAKKGAVLKDLNWLKREREIELGPEKRALFEAQLKSDVALLQRLNIMDYSLLIGLHDMRRGNKENLRQDNLHVFQPETKDLKRQPTQIKRGAGAASTKHDAFALRAAVRRSDPKALGSQQVTKLPDHETSERRHLVFYHDEGGFRSTDEQNQPGDMIYYLGIIDLFTPYTSVKRGEHLWKGLTQNRRMISAVPPKEYGQRFIDFLVSVVKGGDKSRRPKMWGFDK